MNCSFINACFRIQLLLCCLAQMCLAIACIGGTYVMLSRQMPGGHTESDGDSDGDGDDDEVSLWVVIHMLYTCK